jgi:hypothetical protein
MGNVSLGGKIMSGKILFVSISLVVLVFSGGFAIADCPSADLTGDCFVNFEDFALMANQWLDVYDGYDLKSLANQWLTGLARMEWVYIDDPGVDGHEGFTGYMSKYETTNAQYCQYLNSAKADGKITVYNNVVYAVSDTGHSEPYFDTYAASSYSQITYSGGTFSVRSRDGYSMATHPVVEVSWYGATAFCNYYGFRLPTEWEWQAVADYDGSYTYGCGTTISKSKANYYDNGYANPLGLSDWPYTSPVGYYPAYGYGMCDMAGNVCEWTSSIYISSYRVIRGGSWNYYDNYCTVASRYHNDPSNSYDGIGFRVCRCVLFRLDFPLPFALCYFTLCIRAKRGLNTE